MDSVYSYMKIKSYFACNVRRYRQSDGFSPRKLKKFLKVFKRVQMSLLDCQSEAKRTFVSPQAGLEPAAIRLKA